MNPGTEEMGKLVKQINCMTSLIELAQGQVLSFDNG